MHHNIKATLQLTQIHYTSKHVVFNINWRCTEHVTKSWRGIQHVTITWRRILHVWKSLTRTEQLWHVHIWSGPHIFPLISWGTRKGQYQILNIIKTSTNTTMEIAIHQHSPSICVTLSQVCTKYNHVAKTFIIYMEQWFGSREGNLSMATECSAIRLRFKYPANHPRFFG